MQKKLIIKSMIAGLAITLSIFSFVGCSSGKGEKKEELNIINWTELIPDEVIQGFEEEFGVKVNYTIYSSTGEMISKVETAPKGTYDLIIGGGLDILKDNGIIEVIDKSKISNINNINPIYMNQDYDPGNEYTIPLEIAGTVITVDSNIVTGEITSYYDLLDSKFENSLVLVDDSRAVIGMALLACGYDLNSIDDKELEEAKEFLIKLKPNIKVFNGDSPKTNMITGETSIGVIYTAEAVLATKEKSSLKAFYPKEGIYYGMDCFMISKDGKNKELAYKFIEYILRPDVSKIVFEAFPYKCPNLATYDVLSDDYINDITANIPDEVLSKNGPSVSITAEGTAKWDKIWAEFKAMD